MFKVWLIKVCAGKFFGVCVALKELYFIDLEKGGPSPSFVKYKQ